MAEPRIAYLTGEYPRATDTFIQREVGALRTFGFHVQTCSVRRTNTAHHVGPEQRNEAENTFHVLEATATLFGSMRAHFRRLQDAPRRYLRALTLAWRISPPGIRARLYHLMYFLEAVVLADFLLREKIHHLHNHIAKSSCTVAMLASEISGVPFSFTLHGPDIFFEPAFWRLDEKIARASFVACISHFCRSQAMAFSDPKHWRRLNIVHCGVTPAIYETPPKGRGRDLLFVGRLAAVKGVPVLFEAIKALRPDYPDLHLTLVGDGPERSALEAAANDMGLSGALTFAGYQSQSDVAQKLQQTDLFVLPSFAEGVPVVLMEAMAARLPVVATRIAGIPELVDDGKNGLLVSPGDVNGLADALRRLLDDATLRKKLGNEGRKKVCAEFDVQHEAAWLGELLTASLAGKPISTLRPTTHHKAEPSA